MPWRPGQSRSSGGCRLVEVLAASRGPSGFGQGRTPGEPNRWTGARDVSWEPLRPELVCEVAFDHLQGERFRHGATFLRWRHDKPPRACTFAQVDAVVPTELQAIFGVWGAGPVPRRVLTLSDHRRARKMRSSPGSLQRGEPAMMENTRSGAGGYGQVREGMDVLDQNGDKIGKAGETLGGGRYFNVDAGFLGMKEYYVPFEAVTEVQDDAVYVNVTKDRLGEMGWDRRPEEQTAASASAGRVERATDVGRAEAETLQLREEELRARKQQVETGQVRLGKEVVEEQRTLEVPVTREEVSVERQPVERRPAEGTIGTGETETIRVPVREERVEVEKTPVVYEEVGVGKREVTETQQVSDTVRREEARVGQTGEVDVRGAGEAGGWDTAMPRYRERWQQRYGTGGGRWEDDEPGYRYGYELRGRPEYRGRRWDEVEADVRADWERRNPGTPWDRAREAIRETWEDRTP